MSRANPAVWYRHEKKQNAHTKSFKFKRREWQFLERCAGVEKSLDKEFGVEPHLKHRFTF